MVETRAIAAVDINDRAEYTSGPKEGRVLSFGQIQSALSDPISREFEISSASLTLADDDRSIRDAIDQGVARNSVIDFFIYSDVGRRAEVTPLRLYKGLVRSDEELDPLTVRLTIEDRFGSQFSSFDLGKLVPGLTISPVYFSNAPLDTFGKPEQLCYGELSDEPAPPSATPGTEFDTTFAYGGRFDGPFPIAGYAPSISDVAAPANVVVGTAPGGTVSANVPGSRYGVVVTAFDQYSRESTPNPYFYYDPSFLSTITVDGTEKVTASWDPVVGATKYRAYLTFWFAGSERMQQVIETTGLSCEFTTGPDFDVEANGSNITPGALLRPWDYLAWYAIAAVMPDGETVWSTIDDFVYQRGLRRISRIEWFPVVGALSYNLYKRGSIDGSAQFTLFNVPATQAFYDDDHTGSGGALYNIPESQGVVPLTYVGQFTLPDSSVKEGFLVCRGCATSILSWFGGEEIAAGEYERTRFTTESGVFIVPERPAWQAIFGNQKYIDINDRRYTMIFADPSHPSVQLAITRKVPLTANVLGYDAVGDGLGPNGDGTGQVYIDDLPRQYLHFLTNFVVQEAGKLWLTIPLNEDGYSVINGASFEAAKTYYDSKLAGGLKGAWILGVETQEQTGDVLAQLNRCVDGDLFSNEDGQLQLDVCDTETVPAITVVDVEDVLMDSFHAYKDESHFFNEVVYRFGKVYIQQITNPTPAEQELLPRELADKSEWSSGIASIFHETSIPIYGEAVPYDMELSMIRHQPSATYIVKRWLVCYGNEAQYVRFDMNLCGTDIRLAKMINLTHYAGVTLAGWVERKLRLIRKIVDLDALKVTLEFRNINFTYTDIA